MSPDKKPNKPIDVYVRVSRVRAGMHGWFPPLGPSAGHPIASPSRQNAFESNLDQLGSGALVENETVEV